MNTVPLWVTLVGFAVPLLGLAGSAIAYVLKLYQDSRERRRARFFELMQYLDGAGTIASKQAAIYALRQFPEHAPFIVRFCEAQANNLSGPDTATRILQLEFLETAEAMK